MGEWVMVSRGVAWHLGGNEHVVGAMLKAFDPDSGWTEWTTDPRLARRFNSALDVLELWRTQSRTRPLRPDGKPNRPLTAYTVEPCRVCETGDHATVV